MSQGRRSTLRGLLTFTVLVYGLACKSDVTDPGATPRIISLEPDTLSLSIGQTGRLTVEVTDMAGVSLDSVVVRWSSNDPTVATVDTAGLVTALGLGSATITAESEGFAGRAVVQTGLAFTMLSAGRVHTCGLVPGGAVYCWGEGGSGQLGNGTQTSSTTPVRVALAATFVAVSAGGDHTCALTEAGTVFCWGDGARGQRGDGTVSNATLPTPLATGAVFADVSAGAQHTCGITADGTALCWGSSDFGQLGNGNQTNVLLPDTVAGAEPFSSIAAGSDHTCGVGVSGQAYCWGRNDEGQLGTGTVGGPQLVPVALNLAITFRIARAGTGTYSCGIALSRQGYCWGRGDSRQLGLGPTLATNGEVRGLSLAIAFATLDPAEFHTCGTTTQDRTFCWGVSRLGILGTTESEIPLEIPIGLAAITTGSLHTCGLSPGGRAYCWGGNDRGQLGNGSNVPSDVPAPVAFQLITP